MIELDGRQYTVKTGLEYTQDMVNNINDYCSRNDVRNTRGELITIDANLTNPLYIILRALGQLVAIICNLVYSIGCAHSIANSSDAQLLNLADIANVKRRQATKTTIDLVVYSSSEFGCSITTNDTCTVGTNVFRPAFNLDIPANSAGHIVLVADEYGAFAVSAGEITDFDEPIENVRSITQFASIQGQDIESIESLRERLQRRTMSGTAIEAAEDAIMALPGVTTCTIYFNTSPSADATIHGITVRARTALLFVQGFSSDIAKTYYQHLTCDSNPATAERTVTQNYVTHAGQELPVYIITPAQVPCYVRIYLTEMIDEATVVAMKDKVMELCKELKVGEAVTASMVMDKLEEYKLYGLQGVQVGSDDSGFSYVVEPLVDELFVITSDSIEVIQPRVS